MTVGDMDLPESVQEVADVIGRERALYLIGQLPQCGKRSWRVVLYVPKRLTLDHQLVRILGWQDAQRLVRAFGGEILQPSNCRYICRAYRNDAIRSLAADGQTADQLAETFGLSIKQIKNILSENTPDDRRAANANTAPITEQMKVCKS